MSPLLFAGHSIDLDRWKENLHVEDEKEVTSVHKVEEVNCLHPFLIVRISF